MVEPTPHVPSPADIGLEWFLKLRWGAALAQLAAIGVAWLTGTTQHVLVLLGLAALTPLTNAALVFARHRPALDSGVLLRALLLFDLALVTGLLAASGGPSNPFSIFYLVYVTLAATLLGTRWAWIGAGTAVACYGLLFVLVPVERGEHAHHMTAAGAGMGYGAHLWGMFFAFAVSAVLVAHFVTRLARALRLREEELARTQERVARTERLASVMSLAAGTAHEMGTPLATIALVSRELELEAEKRPGAEALLADLRLIRGEVERCRGLLEALGARAGAPLGESPARTRFSSLVDQLRASLSGVPEQQLHVRVDPALDQVTLPPRATVQVLANLVRNALEAGGAPVELVANREGDRLRVQVTDHGRGMSADELAHAREPFFTTKAPGHGLGLGLFLVESFAQQLGGSLTVASRPRQGTQVTLELPA